VPTGEDGVVDPDDPEDPDPDDPDPDVPDFCPADGRTTRRLNNINMQ
jgi:hypothetical protein